MSTKQDYTPTEITTQINDVIEAIKKKCFDYQIVYDSKYDRMFGKHILSKKFKAIANQYSFDNGLEFAIFVIDASMQKGNRRAKKINSCKKIYQKYPDVLNSLPPKKRLNAY